VEMRIDMHEVRLDIVERCFDRSEVEDESSPIRLQGDGCPARARNGAGEIARHSIYFATVSNNSRPSETTSAESGI
jgi:hypothetical protein